MLKSSFACRPSKKEQMAGFGAQDSGPWTKGVPTAHYV